MSKEQNFEDAFNPGVGTCSDICLCGRAYYERVDDDRWEDGEFNQLENDKNATGLDHQIGYVKFEGNTYVSACDCYKDRAQKLMSFIDSHDVQIARYLNAERARKISAAEEVDIVANNELKQVAQKDRKGTD